MTVSQNWHIKKGVAALLRLAQNPPFHSTMQQLDRDEQIMAIFKQKDRRSKLAINSIQIILKLIIYRISKLI
jgi:hypothetical protein